MRGLMAALLSFTGFFTVHALLYRMVVIRRKLRVMLWLWVGRVVSCT